MVTEEALKGDWFYLEGEEAFSPLHATVFQLGSGEVRRHGELVGTYALGAEAVIIEMKRTGEEERATITLRAMDGDASAEPAALSADAEYVFAGHDPVGTYGTFQRKLADYAAAAPSVPSAAAAAH